MFKLFLISFLAFSQQAGDYFELESLLKNARNAPSFRPGEDDKNIVWTVPAKTSGKIQDVVGPFKSGNYALKVVFTNFNYKDKSGKVIPVTDSFYIYFDKKNPGIKLFDANKKRKALDLTGPTNPVAKPSTTEKNGSANQADRPAATPRPGQHLQTTKTTKVIKTADCYSSTVAKGYKVKIQCPDSSKAAKNSVERLDKLNRKRHEQVCDHCEAEKARIQNN